MKKWIMPIMAMMMLAMTACGDKKNEPDLEKKDPNYRNAVSVSVGIEKGYENVIEYSVQVEAASVFNGQTSLISSNIAEFDSNITRSTYNYTLTGAELWLYTWQTDNYSDTVKVVVRYHLQPQGYTYAQEHHLIKTNDEGEHYIQFIERLDIRTNHEGHTHNGTKSFRIEDEKTLEEELEKENKRSENMFYLF